MNPTLESHVTSMNLNTRLFLNCLSGLTEESAQQGIEDGGNSISFVAVHLIDARVYLARTLGATIASPFGKDLDEATKVEDVEQLPPLSDLRFVWQDVSDQLLARMMAVSEEVLMSKSDQEFPGADGTMLGGIAFLLHHESYHLGQMGLLRRQLGFPPMSYALAAEGEAGVHDQ